MDDVIYNADGSIDWNANGWPEPNPLSDPNYDEYSIDGMPDDIFEVWQGECDDLSTDWSADY